MGDADNRPPRPPHRLYLPGVTADPFELPDDQRHGIPWYDEEPPADWEPAGGLLPCLDRSPNRWGFASWCDATAIPGHPAQLCEEHSRAAHWCGHCHLAPGRYIDVYAQQVWRECPTCWRWLRRNRDQYPLTLAGDRALLEALAQRIERRRARLAAKPTPRRRR